MDSLLVRLATNSLYLLLLFLILLLLLHFALIHLFKLDRIGWKRTDYFWLGFAALGLITLSSDVRSWIAPTYLASQNIRTVSTFDRLKASVSPPSVVPCRTLGKSEWSPENIDVIQAEYDIVCDWSRELYQTLPEKVDPDFPPLSILVLPPPDGITDSILNDFIARIESLHSEYMSERKIQQEYEEKTRRSGGEQALLFLSPIFLCLALALRITKVTGEIKLEKEAGK